jgi:hypothetical protein
MNGISTTILYSGISFLVQTQEGGPRAHFVETLIYRRGRLVYSRKSSYTTLLDDPDREDRLKHLIRDQHQAVLDDVADGHLDVHLLKS